MDKRSVPTIRDLYPDLNEEELHGAEDNLEQYLALALRIYDRITADPVAYAHLRTLTAGTGTVSCTRSESEEPPGP